MANTINFTKKDIIAINMQFDEGILTNESSLDYAVTISKRTNSWIKQLAHLIRSILLDHAFKDANKRTSAVLIGTYTEINGYNPDKEEINKIVLKITKKNIKNINEIERLIENAVK